jgi:hypothetical protein
MVNISLKFYQIYKLCVDILGNDSTTDKQLSDLLFEILPNNFKGVYTVDDELPKLINNYDCYILNNLTRESKGEHWLSIIKYNDKVFLYDSFDRDTKKISPKHFNVLDKFINLSNLDHILNPEEQSLYQYTCGCFCVSFLVTCISWNLSPIDLKKNI